MLASQESTRNKWRGGKGWSPSCFKDLVSRERETDILKITPHFCVFHKTCLVLCYTAQAVNLLKPSSIIRELQTAALCSQRPWPGESSPDPWLLQSFSCSFSCDHHTVRGILRHGAHTRKVFLFIYLMHALVRINYDFLWIFPSPPPFLDRNGKGREGGGNFWKKHRGVMEVKRPECKS